MPDPSPRYPIPARRYRTEIEVERSRFITTVQEVISPEAVARRWLEVFDLPDE